LGGGGATGVIKPVDFIEDLSVEKAHEEREALMVKGRLPVASSDWFSHEKHAIWAGCELCHPDIFPCPERHTPLLDVF
jgi:hypothetical protein